MTAIAPLSTSNAPLWVDPWYDWCDHAELRPRDSWGWRACAVCAVLIPPEHQEYPTAEHDPGILGSVLELIRRGASYPAAFELLGVEPRLYRRWMSADCDDPGAAWVRACVRRARAAARVGVELEMYQTDKAWWALNGPEREGRPGVEPGEGFGPAPRAVDVKQTVSGGVRVDLSRLPESTVAQIAEAALAAIEDAEIVPVEAEPE